MMIALSICVLLNWPSGGAIDLGAESFGLEADDAPLGGGAGREHVIFAPDAVDASIVYCGTSRPPPEAAYSARR